MKKREIVLIIILIILLCGVGYYFSYFIPSGERIAVLESSVKRKTEDVDFAAQQVLIWAALSRTKESNAEAWEELGKTVPEEFDEADVLTRIQRIVYPYTRDVAVRFHEAGTQMEAAAVHTVEISFTVPYDDLQSILGDFADEDIANRVSYINCSRAEPDMNAYEATGASTAPSGHRLAVNMSVDFLSR